MCHATLPVALEKSVQMVIVLEDPTMENLMIREIREMEEVGTMVAGMIETAILLKNAMGADASILLTTTVITASLIKNVFMENASVIAITMMVVIITPINVHMIEIAVHLSNVIKELVYQKVSPVSQLVKVIKHVIMESVTEITDMDVNMILIVINLKVVSRESVFQM